MAFGDAAEQVEGIGGEQSDRHAGLLRRRPQPVEQAILQPLPMRFAQQDVAQSQRAGLVAPDGDTLLDVGVGQRRFSYNFV